jgi:hypothetical protein
LRVNVSRRMLAAARVFVSRRQWMRYERPQGVSAAKAGNVRRNR